MPGTPSRTEVTGRNRLANLWLALATHADGFRANPRAYLVASTWWLLKKRVRARGQLAPLLSQSPRAYTYWMAREAQTQALTPSVGTAPPIFALVAANGDAGALETTLQSLAAEGVRAFVIADDVPTAMADVAAAITGENRPWLLPMIAGDRLATGAADAYRAAIAAENAALFYADDDLVDGRGLRVQPHFKPDWNSELFRHHDYLTGSAIIRPDSADLDAAATQADWAGSLIARAAGQGPVHHVRRVLHHRASRRLAALPVTPAQVATNLPPVSIIVPTRNRLDLLRTCVEGVFATRYPDIDLIIVDNDSDDPETLAWLAALPPERARVLRHPGPFNYSTINNRAVAQARGDLICLLNNDIEVIDPDWLAIMATQAQRPDVGAVGAKLLYPDGRIQHAGVVIGVGNAAGHAHRFVRPQEDGYFRRHNLPQFVMAVTAACLVVARDRFLAVGGLDETNFAVAFNDVDLCLRLNQRGWQSLYEPRATMIHHESVSRGHDRDPVGAARLASEIAALQRLWKTNEIVDPFHHPQLSRASERFAVAI